MRRLLTASLAGLVSAALPGAGSAQSIPAPTPSLAGTREIGVFLSGRLLSSEYSADEGKTGFGGALTFATHLKSMLAFQAGIAGNYSRQGYSFLSPAASHVHADRLDDHPAVDGFRTFSHMRLSAAGTSSFVTLTPAVTATRAEASA
jgi:hypothetical protein